MRSLHTRWINRAALAPALLTLTGFILLPSAQAQAVLDLGQSGSTTASGTATLTDTGTTASGIYTYDDFGSGIPLSLQNGYNGWTTYGLSTANIDGGVINYFSTFNTSTANVSGSVLSLSTYDSSTANVSGGSVHSIETFVGSTANVSGGNTSYLATSDTSTINLFGTGFTKTFVGTDNYGGVVYAVKGTLQDGTRVDAAYHDYGGQLLFSNPVPEASSVISFGLLLVLGLGGLMVSARRRKSTVAG